jgi:hypothetical protein
VRNLPLRGPVVLAVLVGAVLALPAGALASMGSMPSMPSMPSKPSMASKPGPPIPGGVYRGATNRGARVTIRIAGDAPTGTITGTFHVGCVPGRAMIHSSNGTFIARGRGFRATGTFNIDRIGGRITLPRRARCAGTHYQVKLSSPGGVKSTVVRYGSFKVNPMSMTMPMSSNMFNMMGSMQDFWVHGAQKPCSSCDIVGIVPNLVYPNGKTANYNTGVMLHHFVMFNGSTHDVTCPSWPQRLFASGNERSDMVLPAGYGYHVAATDTWHMLVELMNMSMNTQNVQVQVTYYYLPASAHVRHVTPMWLDENNCGNSDYAIPAGHSNTVWSYKVPATGAGDIVAIAGHLHDYGTHISLTDTTTGKLICNSKAAYGQVPGYKKNIDSMSGCIASPLAVIRTGDRLRLDSYYNSPMAESSVMGIMMAYVDVGAFNAPHQVATGMSR